MNDIGYTFSWRRKWEHPVFRNKQEAAVWAWMCDVAQWQDYRMPTKFGPVSLKRGELLIAERAVADDFGLHRNTLRTLLHRMVDDGMIEFKKDRCPHRAGTIVGILKYEQYQSLVRVVQDGQDRKRTEKRTEECAEEGPKEDRSETKNNTYNTDNTKKESISPLPPAGGCVSADAGPDLFAGFLPEEPKPVETKAKAPRTRPLYTEAEIDKLFEEFMAAYPARHKPHSVKGARRSFAAALKKKVDPKALIAGAGRYCQEVKNEGNYGKTFTKDACNWLAEGKWEEYDGVHKFPVAEPEWKTNPRAWNDPKHPPPWPDAPVGTRAGLWLKASMSWVRYA